MISQLHSSSLSSFKNGSLTPPLNLPPPPPHTQHLHPARQTTDSIARSHTSGGMRLGPRGLNRVQELLFHHGRVDTNPAAVQLVWLQKALLFFEADGLATNRVYVDEKRIYEYRDGCAGLYDRTCSACCLPCRVHICYT
jgi:hypothetical protein